MSNLSLSICIFCTLFYWQSLEVLPSSLCRCYTLSRLLAFFDSFSVHSPECGAQQDFFENKSIVSRTFKLHASKCWLVAQYWQPYKVHTLTSRNHLKLCILTCLKANDKKPKLSQWESSRQLRLRGHCSVLRLYIKTWRKFRIFKRRLYHISISSSQVIRQPLKFASY